MTVLQYVLAGLVAIAVAAVGAPEARKIAGTVASQTCEIMRCGGPR